MKLRQLLVILCALIIAMSFCTGNADTTLHLKQNIVEGLSTDEVSAIESIVNKYDSAYLEAYAVKDPALLGKAYSTWDILREDIGKLQVSDPVEVAEIKWNINAAGYSMMFGFYYDMMMDALGHKISKEELMLEVLDFLDMRKSYGGDAVNASNVNQIFWEQTTKMHSEVLKSFE